MPITSAKEPFDLQLLYQGVVIVMSFRQSIGSSRSRRAVVLTPLIIALNAVLIWTLAHTDIVAFATIFVAGVVCVSGAFWATGSATSRRMQTHRIPQAEYSDYGGGDYRP